MKVALIGTGKTGRKIIELHPNTEAFNTSRPATPKALGNCDIIIVFTTGKVFLENMDMILASKKPTVIASTGLRFPEDTQEKLVKENVVWVQSNNFSIGMSTVRRMLQEFGKLQELIGGKFSIHDIHHKDKLDAPSGTALSMEKWLNQRAAFSSERLSDVIGEHRINFESEFESITLTHRAKDRAVFAKGALWCANSLFKKLPAPGLWDFFDYLEHLKEENGPQ